jgi:putative PIN family toxin of toxin-antitoxin system
LDEYDDVLSRPYPANKLAILGIDRRVLIATVFEHSEIVIPASVGSLQVRDVKDQRILETAIAGSADFLVSGDKDLLALAGHPDLGTLQIVDPPMFLDYLASLD